MRVWEDVLKLPEHMVQEIKGRGRYEEYDNESNLTDSDDLALAIELPAHHHLLLPSESRLIMNEDGSVTIQLLKKGE